ncbi:hypothetical protein DMC30DRAFT_46303 [Rhodotorula diobovata]|uniref:HMG box domain-containing protein n=1 Tax=Rhodotorula diobovata TaxID=5288 RepID=A0A5C5G469_9BASI|nr:hypothetical protein DMC30DRAFT_46303 [Rhodotorula diobovata]
MQSFCPPSPGTSTEVAIKWEDVLGVDSHGLANAPPSLSARDARTPPSTAPPSSCGRWDLPTPVSLAAASPMARSVSQVSVPPSPFEAALATLKSPPRSGRRSRKRACTDSITETVIDSSTGAPLFNPAAPTSWTGPGIPSVLLRSVSDTSCPTRASLSLSRSAGASSSTTLLPSPFLHGDSTSHVEGSADVHGGDIVVDSPNRKRKKSAKKPEGHIPRPPNSFFLYRSARLKELTAGLDESSGAKLQQADLSRQIAAMWKAESPAVREEYARQAAEEKEAHAQRYPDYAFRPRPRPSRRASAKGKLERSTGASASPASEYSVASSFGHAAPSGLVGADTLGDLLPAIELSGHGSPISPSSVYGGFPTTPSTATSSTFESYFLPPSTAVSDAWSTFRSAPLAWADTPSTSTSQQACVQQPFATDFCPPPQSAPAGLTGFELAMTPPPSTGAFYTPLPMVTDATLLPPPPLTYEDLLASVPLAGLISSPPFDPSSSVSSSSGVVAAAQSPDDSLRFTALPQLSEQTYTTSNETSQCAAPQDGFDTSTESFEAFFQQFAAHYPSP